MAPPVQQATAPRCPNCGGLLLSLVLRSRLWRRNGSALLIQHGASDSDGGVCAGRLALKAARQLDGPFVIGIPHLAEDSFDFEIGIGLYLCHNLTPGAHGDCKNTVFACKTFGRVSCLDRIEDG